MGKYSYPTLDTGLSALGDQVALLAEFHRK